MRRVGPTMGYINFEDVHWGYVWAHIASTLAAFGVVLGVAPFIVGAIPFVWYSIQIYESGPVKRWRAQRAKRKIRKLTRRLRELKENASDLVSDRELGRELGRELDRGMPPPEQ